MILAQINEAVAAGARLGPAAEILGLSKRTVQRWQAVNGGEDGRHGPRSRPPNKLSAAEREGVVTVMNSPQFCDLPPTQIVPRLADADIYVASESTFYRIMRDRGELTHRERSRPPQARPRREHLATAPNQLWSWDITYLKTSVPGKYYYLYLVIDVWSRKIVGARVESRESSELAAQLFVDICHREQLDPKGIVLHSDNGGPMRGLALQLTLEWLGIAASFSRPAVKDDNPFSEALFRTMKYRPEYPARFASLAAASQWVDEFVHWYNHRHLHSAICFVTPEDRHCGREAAVLSKRTRVYQRARQRHPMRWPGSARKWEPVAEVYLNPEPRKES